MSFFEQIAALMLSGVFLSIVSAGDVSACSINILTKAELRDENRKARESSLPVEVGSDCRVRNAGIHDDVLIGPATKLNRGRVYQGALIPSLGRRSNGVLVADCNTAFVTMITALPHETGGSIETNCGPLTVKTHRIIPPDGEFSLEEGERLSDLAKLVSGSATAQIDYELSIVTQDDLGFKVPRKDRFDLLCGCKLHYPGTRGGER